MPDAPEVRAAAPVLVWPDTLPGPQAPSFKVTGPPRAELINTLSGSSRIQVNARTAPMRWEFQIWLTREQQEAFEAFYRDSIENHDGEFYARWIGGSRVVAFPEAYSYVPHGDGWILQGTLVRTRIDTSACDAHINAEFGAIYRDQTGAVDVYAANLTAPDRYQDDFSLALIADEVC